MKVDMEVDMSAENPTPTQARNEVDMTVDIAAIRAAVERWLLFPMQRPHRETTLVLWDPAERELDRQGVVSSHWDDCWKAHDRCAAALWRQHMEAHESLESLAVAGANAIRELRQKEHEA